MGSGLAESSASRWKILKRDDVIDDLICLLWLLYRKYAMGSGAGRGGGRGGRREDPILGMLKIVGKDDGTFLGFSGSGGKGSGQTRTDILKSLVFGESY